MKSILLSFLLLFLTSGFTNAQQLGLQTLEQLQESPAGNRILTFVSTVNDTGTPTEDWVRTNFSPNLLEKLGVKGLLSFIGQIREMDGGLQIYDADRKEVFAYKLKAKGTRSGNWVDMDFLFEEEPPYRIQGFGLDISEQPAQAQQALFPPEGVSSGTGSDPATDFTSIPLPSTPAGRRLAELIASFENGDYESYLKENFASSFFEQVPFPEALAMTEEIALESRGYRVHSLLQDSTHLIEVLAYARNMGGWQKLFLQTDVEPPHQIAMVGIDMAKPPGFDPKVAQRNLVEKTLSSPHPKGRIWVKGELGEKLDQFLSAEFEKGFSGAALVVKGGEKVLYKGYGLANRANLYINTTETLFDAGSIMKDFTDAAILKLEALGKLSLDDPISKFLPGVPADKQKISIHHLLWHASGLVGNHSPHDDTEMSFERALAEIFQAPLRFEPGSDRQYSNSGFTVLAAIIEKASGQSYLDYIEQEIIAPADLEGWAYFGQKERMQADQVALAYDGIDRGNYNDPYQRALPGWQILGAGGICLSLETLYQFSMAIKAGKVMPPSATKKFLEVYNPARTGKFDTPTRLFGGGSDIGFTMLCLDFPEEDAYVIMASNTGNFKNPTMADPLANLFLGRKLSTTKKPFQPRTAQEWGLPETPAGQRAVELLNIVSAGNPATFGPYAKKAYAAKFYDAYSEQMHIQFLKEVASTLEGPPKLKKIQRTGEGELSFYMDALETGESLKVSIKTTAQKPHQIESLSIGQ